MVIFAMSGALVTYVGLSNPVKAAASLPNRRAFAPTPDVTTPTPPTDVNLSGSVIQDFDDYSWRAFIAMVWPAKHGQRGEPDTGKTVDGSGPRVFETYKQAWEIFHNKKNSPPAPWNLYEKKKFSPCKMASKFGDIELASFAHSEVGQASFGGMFWPLASQNHRYVRFLTSFNKIEFDTIASGKLYERKNLPRPPHPLEFPNGAIDIKSAWMLMKGVPNPSHYYTRWAWVRSSKKPYKCSKQLVGLIGIHIVQKTPTRPQWIWSSFEQEDNVPDPGSVAPFNLNDGSGSPQPKASPLSLKPLKPEPVQPYNVVRMKPINTSTVATNGLYHAALPANSVWRHYKLVMTQWPVPGSNPSQTGNPGHTFPGFGSATDTANMAMESFHQSTIQLGCMNCHTGAQPRADFLWTLYNHSYPAKIK